MNVLYDYQTLTMQRFGGISRYYYELAKGLSKESGVTADVKTVFNINHYFKDYFEKKKPESLPWFFKKANNAVNRAYVLMQNKKKYDIIHPTYYHPYILNKFKGKYVVTIHDMIYEIYKDVMPDAEKVIAQKKAHIFAADKIICVSEWTKRDLLKFYPQIGEEKIKVVYQGNGVKADSENKLPVIKALENVKKYVLFTGNRGLYKNFKNMAEAVSGILKNDKDLYLVCGGGGAFDKAEREFLSELGIADKCIQLRYAEEETASLYNNAECFVFPSLYEGFGIPILEAWECRCPLVLSNASCFPEIAGDAGAYFDGNSVSDIKSAVEKVLYDDGLKAELIKKGLSRARLYGWDKTVGNTLELYKSLL